MPITVPTPADYAHLSYAERMRCYQALKRLLCHWAEYELEQLPAQKREL